MDEDIQSAAAKKKNELKVISQQSTAAFAAISSGNSNEVVGLLKTIAGTT